MPASSLPDATRPAPTLLSLSAPVCELINLSPFGKLERRSRGLLSLAVPVLLLGPAKTHCGLGAQGGEWGQQDELGRHGCPLSPPLLAGGVGGGSGFLAPSPSIQHP